jgi:hypothetical protein
MDEDGFVALSSVGNVAARARVSLEAAEAAIRALETPDTVDPGQEHDGRRIERVPSGWMVLNSAKYRDIIKRASARESTRLRVARFRARNADVTVSNEKVTSSVSVSVSEQPSESLLASTTDCPHLQIINAYHRHLPMGRQVTSKWNGTRKSHLQARWREDKDRQSIEWWERFFDSCAKSAFLTGKVPPRQGSTPFQVSLDWIVSPGNFVKIIEGAYARESGQRESKVAMP